MPTSDRDWRIHADFSQRLIVQARALYANEPLATELNETAYALDSTTIDLWSVDASLGLLFRTTKRRLVKMRTLLDLRGSIPSGHSHLGRQAPRRATCLTCWYAGSEAPLTSWDRAYIDVPTACTPCHQVERRLLRRWCAKKELPKSHRRLFCVHRPNARRHRRSDPFGPA